MWPQQPSLRIPLPGRLSPSQNAEQLRCSSPSLSPFCTSQLQQKGQQVTHPQESKWVTLDTLKGGGKMYLHSLGQRKARCVSLMSHCYVTAWITALSTDCQLKGKATQASGKAVKLQHSQSFQYPLGCTDCSCQIRSPAPLASMWSDAFSENDPSGNAQRYKISSQSTFNL